MARHIVGARMPSVAELNEANRRAHAGAGASGQVKDDARPSEQNGAIGLNRRGAMLEAQSSDLSEAFASELDKIPSGQQPNGALNTYHTFFYRAKPGAARDAVDKIWSAFRRR